MNIEDIKVGETYYVRVKVLNKSRAHIGCCTVGSEGNSLVEFMTGESPAFVPIPPTVPTGGTLHQSDDNLTKGKDLFNLLTGTKNTETAPKYDPCREFREGDKVRVRKIHGKLPQCRYNGMVKVKEGDCCTIHKKEHRNCYWVTIPSGGNWCFDAAYLELVTPVEELNRYKVAEDYWNWLVIHDKGKALATVSKFSKKNHPEAKAAAEDECARLNGAHRKGTEKTELGRMDYINKRCHNCKHFHFGNLTNSWCSYHNEDVCTIGKPCLCWELRKEQNND